jgi:large subunit ribosomal protein L3
METIVLKGKKQHMSQLFTVEGKVMPITVVKVENELIEDYINKDVDIIGTSKGKGFTGAMKKWGFHGEQATRGQSTFPRSPGSVGAQTPGRVLKGKKMAGKHGNKRVTIKGSKILGLNIEGKEVFVLGPIPGARNSLVSIKVKE